MPASRLFDIRIGDPASRVLLIFDRAAMRSEVRARPSPGLKRGEAAIHASETTAF
jgi:hypothetical protein